MNTENRLFRRFLPGLWLTQVLAGCHSSEPAPAATRAPISPAPMSPSQVLPAPASIRDPWHGHVGGTASGLDPSVAHGWSVDGVVTEGLIRLDISSYDQPYEKSVQFVGRIDSDGDRAFGSGGVIGQACAAEAPRRFCGDEAFAGITLTATSPEGLAGTIDVIGPNGPETWLLDLQLWGYDFPADVEYLEGTYELRAEFASDGTTLVSLDGAGRLFFQSPSSGCIGNGALTPRPGGGFDVFDVTLTLESCRAEHALLNGVFEGLATEDPSNPWNYDSALYVWISTAPGAPAPAAVKMIGLLL